MESSPSKRQKLSPTASIDRQSELIHSHDVLPPTPRPASFVSPTKASLARYNPSLLPRLKSAGEVSQPSDSARQVIDRQHGEKMGRLSNGLNPVGLRSTVLSSSPTKLGGRLRASTVSPNRNSISSARGTSHAPKWSSRTPGLGRALSPAKVQPRSNSPVITASPLRPAQDSEAAVEDTESQPLEFESSASAAAPLQSGPVSKSQNRVRREEDHEEPELPLTPTQLGLQVAPEPPKGLLYSSPSRKLGKRNGSSVKSSPLKPLNAPLRSYSHSLFGEEPATTDEATEARLGDAGRPEEDETVAKKKILDQLLLQYQELKNDVEKIENEIRHQDAEGLTQADELISIITSSNPMHERARGDEKLVSISSRIAQFMPFSKPLVPRKQPTPISSFPVPSHYPLQLEDSLTHLRAFTPLTIESVNSLVPSSDSSQPWLQHHDITLTSPGNFLLIELHLVVNPGDRSVDSLTLSSVSSWAAPEVIDWLNGQAASGDLPTIGWACGRYWEVTLLRARCWKRCDQRFPGLVPAPLELQNSTVYAGIKTANYECKSGSTNGDEIDLNGIEGTEDLQSNLDISDSDLRAKLGQQSMLFSASGVSFLVTWKVGFNWTGEVESCISACASFPKAWQIADERASLGHVGKVFDLLLQDRGVFEAIRIIVGLLYE